MAKPLPAPSLPPRDLEQTSHYAGLHPCAALSLASGIEQLAPTEADLLTAGIGRHVVPLKPDWLNILNDLFSLGPVRLVTAGTAAFIEKHGVYPLPEFSGSTAALFDGRMKLETRLDEWRRAFAVFSTLDHDANLTECGLHFFSNSGIAIHRVFLSPSGSVEAFERIAEEYRHYGRGEPPCIVPGVPSRSELIAAANAAESAAGTERSSEKLVRRVQNYEVLRAFHNSQQAALPIRISIGTPGCSQTHTGILRSIQSSKVWTRAVDGDTILYVRDADIAETRIVESTAGDGLSLFLEAIDVHGRTVVTLCGEEPGSRKSSYRWNQLLEGLSDV